MNDAFSHLPEPARHIAAVQQRHQMRLIEQANVRGVEIGKKYVGGEETDELCIVVLVSSKLPRDVLAEDDLVPPLLDDIPTDVKEVGAVRQLAVDLTERLRPAPGGASISRAGAGAPIGTLGTACFPRREAMPREYYLLSCNHVLANNNFAQFGDDIVQPASGDGGTAGDVIGKLSEWVPIQFCVPTGAGTFTCAINYVDAAMAACRIGAVNREIHWVGYPRRSAPQGVAVPPQVGMRVQKTGRTSGFTFGEIVGINVLFGPLTITTPVGQRQALFGGQIRTTPMAFPGDSGAIACEVNVGVAIGMVFAGGTQETILNDIVRVEQALGVRIAAA